MAHGAPACVLSGSLIPSPSVSIFLPATRTSVVTAMRICVGEYVIIYRVEEKDCNHSVGDRMQQTLILRVCDFIDFWPFLRPLSLFLSASARERN